MGACWSAYEPLLHGAGWSRGWSSLYAIRVDPPYPGPLYRCVLGSFLGSALVDGKLSLGSGFEIRSVPVFPQCYPCHQL